MKKGTKVKLSSKVWGNHWFDNSVIISKNKSGTFNIKSEDGNCKMENVEEKFLKPL